MSVSLQWVALDASDAGTMWKVQQESTVRRRAGLEEAREAVVAWFTDVYAKEESEDSELASLEGAETVNPKEAEFRTSVALVTEALCEERPILERLSFGSSTSFHNSLISSDRFLSR